MNRFKLKPIAIILIAVCAISAGAIALFLSKSGATDKPAAAPASTARPALTVTTTQPQMSALPIKLTANGNIAAWQDASIGTESNGLRLAEVLVNVGDVVQRGQLLARFAVESMQADVAQARAGVAEATANAAEATANADRVRTLQSTGTFSGQQINQYLTAEQTARARVESAKAALAAQQLRLQNTQVLAPDSGIISARSATVGAVVANGTELFRLIRQGRLEWRAEVTSTELGRMVPGTKVTVTAASGTQLPGKVRMVAPTVDPQTRAGLVYVDLPPMLAPASAAAPGRPRQGTAPSGGSAVREAASVGAVIPGMFARGEFELGSSSALTVPQQSVVVRDGFSYVFRLNADQRVSQIKLQTGRRVGDRVEVLDGVAADAVLVASGAGFLNDGDLVKAVPAAAAAPAIVPNTAPAPVSSASSAIK
ncbi:MAG: efflux RND transporter periplasmic adaptor subunit [Rhodoferax sp.]|uniref:efflux RND transporter periplasmic adaptor subunit n=1 Tax=Rhodoferax sp. TaxID=50421 RepID=UPI0027228B10|nr:efflux RND transporter periplasmic adaptor subunit [Rhodoferax sp.]MDO8447271.1 efflux RND transporter periplasmic adaptor subunit [Rhodoferax sp.]